MALAANADYVIRGREVTTIEAVNAADIFKNAYLMGGNRDHGTAGVIGRARAWNDEVGAIPLGFAASRETGNTGASPTVKAQVDLMGRIIKSCPVTGLAGTNADVFRLVYATDDGTFDLTRPTLGHPVGIITAFRTSALADVYFFSFGELCVLGMAGAGRPGLWMLGTVNGVASAGNHATGIVAPCHGRILSVYGIVFEPQTDADAACTINLEIGGTDVTGGVITWVTADVLGDKKSGTAITALNVFHEGDLIDIEVAAGTAGTAADGYMNIYANVLCEPGL